MKLQDGTMGLIIGESGLIVQVEMRKPANDGKPVPAHGGGTTIDSGITLYCDDAPGPEQEVTEAEWLEIARPVCVHCILKSHPTIGRALRLAKRDGRAVFVDGRWQPSKYDGGEG